jgi:hypothetical protein
LCVERRRRTSPWVRTVAMRARHHQQAEHTLSFCQDNPLTARRQHHGARAHSEPTGSDRGLTGSGCRGWQQRTRGVGAGRGGRRRRRSAPQLLRSLRNWPASWLSHRRVRRQRLFSVRSTCNAEGIAESIMRALAVLGFERREAWSVRNGGALPGSGTVGMVAYAGRAPLRFDAHGRPGAKAALEKKRTSRAPASWGARAQKRRAGSAGTSR